MEETRKRPLRDESATESADDPDHIDTNTDAESGRNSEQDTPVGADSSARTPTRGEQAREQERDSQAQATTSDPGERTVVPRDAYGRGADTAESGQAGPAPRGVLESHVDTGVGSTALTATEGWVQTNSREPQNDGRSPTRTYFDPNDVAGRYPGGQQHRDPSERRSWQTLAQWQDGVQSDISRGAQNWWADKKRWVDMFADQMGATEYHAERCHHILADLDVSDYQPDRIPAELIIVGILSLLIDHDISDPENFSNRALKRGRTEALLDDLDVDVRAYESVRSKLRQRDGDIIFGD